MQVSIAGQKYPGQQACGLVANPASASTAAAAAAAVAAAVVTESGSVFGSDRFGSAKVWKNPGAQACASLPTSQTRLDGTFSVLSVIRRY
jgi:anthranilate phosphoribosyltransferase